MTGIIALAAHDFLIAYMNYSHVSINLPLFLIPFLSILLCERSLYLGESLFNFVLMEINPRLVSRNGVASQTAYHSPTTLFDRFGAASIRTR